MKSGPFTIVMDTYDWLPPEGEIAVSLFHEKNDLKVEITYEEEETQAEQSKTLVFSSACSFTFHSAPGVKMTASAYDKVCTSGELVEYEFSEAAKAWSDHFKHFQIKHYQIYFAAQNKILEVFSRDWSVQ